MRLFAPRDVERLEARRDVKGLMRVLAHTPAPSERQAAAVALGKLGDLRALPGLEQALADPQPDVRRAAAAALGQLDDSRAVEPLIAALHDHNIDQWVIPALGRLRDPRAFEPLLTVLDQGHGGPKFGTAMAVVNALGNLGDRRATPFLMPLMHDKDYSVRRIAASALHQLGWAPVSADEAVAYAAAIDDWSACTSIGTAAVEPLIRMLVHEDPAVRGGAASALGLLDDPAAVPPLIGVLRDSDHFVCKAAATALDQLGWEPAGKEGEVDYWIAQEDWTSDMRPKDWLQRLAESGPSAVEGLLRLLGDPDRRYRSRAAWALGKIPDERAVLPLIARLYDDHIRVCRSAALALVEMYHSGKLDEAAKAKILAERARITYKQPEEEDWDEERFGNPPPVEDRSIDVDFPL